MNQVMKEAMQDAWENRQGLSCIWRNDDGSLKYGQAGQPRPAPPVRPPPFAAMNDRTAPLIAAYRAHLGLLPEPDGAA